MENAADAMDARRQRIRRVTADCIRRRHAGEALTDEQVVSEHPGLMPELAEELRRLALVQQAAQRSGPPPDPDPTTDGPVGADPLGGTPADADASSQIDVRRIQSWSSLDQTSPEPPSPSFSVYPSLTESITGYEIVREIHRGGQGVVYQAIQKNTKRKVAIKVMREGPFASPRDKARFEREVQILASLNHPHIVAIHDSGLAAGNFYFVMDYISGQPLDVYMSSGRRTVEETLRLFVRIGSAVNAAHLRGIIHRDLKPSNIRIDANGEPHILDFGLAKMAMGQVTDESRPQVMTITGQFVGSLPWASPEQAEGIPGKIDVRTDVYSLGVVLYEMLTGKFPYEVVGHMRDVLDRIMHAEPVRPRAVRGEIGDEVETIVLKCLTKERERRYQSAGELVRDVERYLAGEPIEAKRDSTIYLLRKTLLRYRMAAVVGCAFTLLAVLAALWLGIMYERQTALLSQVQSRKAEAEGQRLAAEQARVEAVAARQEEQRLRVAAENARRAAEEQRIRTEDALEEARRREEEARKAGDALERLLRNKGDFASVEPYFQEQVRRARRPDGRPSPALATALHNLAGILRAGGHHVQAEKLYSEALAVRRELFPAGHPLLEQSLTSLAAVLGDQEKYAEAESLYLEALQHPGEGGDEGQIHTLQERVELGRTLVHLQKYEDAQKHLLEAHRQLQHLHRLPPRELTLTMLETLAELYKSWNSAVPDQTHAAESARWRSQLEEARRQTADR